MFKFHDGSGESGKITAGCIIVWWPNARAITIYHEFNVKAKGNVFRWNDDDRRILYFIRNNADFVDFVEVLAEILGLKTRAVECHNPDVLAFEFIN